ncbi:phage tail tape measure protein [Leisingera sp. NJS201]|uniref:phage tail tape measure protein n=1 Tax=Leisingera sp. NJS201 TaxID=2508306 RepID=UPI001070D2F4|nr:phage tail tape measure protein [Leisingera sp. NJS201]QBR35766.1 phage tail tape measure protein [Leisingera sp. NJS201]
MATKRIETQLTIKAVDRYSGMLRNMRTVTGRFADGVRTEMGRLQGMRGPLQLIEDFRKQQQVVRRSGDALEAAREKQRRLLAEIRATRHPTAQMRREFERARGAADSLAQQHHRNRRALHGLQGKLREAGVNTGDLAGEQRRLASALDGASTAFGRQMERMRRLEAMQARIAEARERMDRSLATAANLSFVGNASMQTGRRILTGLSGPVQQAIAFETAMSDVRKVVDFDTPEGFRQMSDDILQLSTRIPMAADGLAQIVASGGQSGLARGELTRFAEMAAKIGVAFDISAEQSGDSMANIKTALGLTLDETGLLFDAMNHLSNKMASTAPKVLDFTNRVAVDGAVKGFSPTETMAFGSAMIAAGAGADVAATSFRNMGKALARGEGATDRQSAAFEKLGLDAEAVARAMQDDAVGTTIDVMRRINELPKHLQSSVTSDLFGDEARALAPLIKDLDLLRDALGLVSEEQEYQGSAEREYAVRAKTTANNLRLMRNHMTRLGISIGDVVLPPLNDLLELSQGVINRMVAWTKEHPKLTKWLVIGAAAVGAWL